MQAKYSGKPVRFMLFPCNQFGAQEPKPNVDVKTFAQKSATIANNGEGSNVILFAKSNVNNVPCTYAGQDACTATSAECCPENDAVYRYLLSHTPPGKLDWNFDKIIVGKDGKPFAGEVIFKGPALDDELSATIDRLLGADAATLEAAAAQVEARIGSRWSALAAAVGAITALGVVVAKSWARGKAQETDLMGESGGYIRVA